MVQSLRVDGAWSLHNYELFFARPHYIATLKTTFAVAAISTCLSIALAFPVCAFMATRSKRAVMVFVGCVMLSLALSGLVRTLSWQIVLSRSGPLNAILLWLGVLPRPVNMLFTRGAVVVGMVQILLPYAIALILSGMRRVDLEFVFAARSLGASAVGAFRSAYLPQIRRSLCSAALLVFVLATGFIITPALLGGTGEMMIGNVMLVFAVFYTLYSGWDYCRAFLPGIIERGRGGILNVGSLAGFQPGPNLAVYYATKAYVLSFTEALSEEDHGRDLEAVRTELGELKEKIERIGPVNPLAVQEAQENEERYAFMTSQRQDLLDSIKELEDAIRQIDTESRSRFEEAFHIINANFQETFKQLFGGGSAGLALVDNEDILEAGIDIMAMPPGKKLQNVLLLSGGEKAMTAIGLLFAIFKYKPSPFCILDEVDAPLDDANIGRFVKMLDTIRGNTQFIIITHSRKTMQIADNLYGVTMEEPGVSKLVSVKFN